MLDIKYVVENTQAVKQALAGRNGEFPVDKAVELELKRRETIKEVETLKARRNSESAKVAQLKREKEERRRHHRRYAEDRRSHKGA